MKTQIELALVLALIPVALSAQTVNVDFSRDITSPIAGSLVPALFAATGPAGVAGGTFWNDYSVYLPAVGDQGANSITNPYSVNNLTASDGITATTIDVTLTSGWYRSFNGTVTINDLQQEWVFAQLGQSATMTIGGLNSSLTYDLYLVAGATINTSFTIGATTLNATGATGDGVTWTPGLHYVLFSGIAPDLAGNIAVGIQDGIAPINGNGGIAGLQIVPVPEPSTTLLLVGSLVGLTFRRRR
jgi:hypothetical protein